MEGSHKVVILLPDMEVHTEPSDDASGCTTPVGAPAGGSYILNMVAGLQTFSYERS